MIENKSNFVARILTENPDFGIREKSETWKSYFQIVLYVYIWCILENIKKPSFLSKTGPRTKFVRENFFTRKLPITCRFQICTFWKTGLPDKKPDSGIRDIKIGIIHVWMVQNHIAKELIWYLQKPGNPDMSSNFVKKI